MLPATEDGDSVTAAFSAGRKSDNRFLRIRDEDDKSEEDLEKDSDDEERTLPKLSDELAERSAKALAKLTNNGALAKVDDEMVHLMNRLTYIEYQNQPLLKAMQDSGWSPLSLGKQLKIHEKEAVMTKAELAKDLDYQFWLQFRQFWIAH